jgi:hypothetical protein
MALTVLDGGDKIDFFLSSSFCSCTRAYA